MESCVHVRLLLRDSIAVGAYGGFVDDLCSRRDNIAIIHTIAGCAAHVRPLNCTHDAIDAGANIISKVR